MELKDRVAIVTGAGRGIGRAIAMLLAREGACVVVNSLTKVSAEKAALEIERTDMTLASTTEEERATLAQEYPPGRRDAEAGGGFP